MDRLPPKIVRRLILAPLVFVISLALIVLSPALLIVAALADLALRGRRQTVRVTMFGIVYLAYEILGLLAMFGLWLASGFGVRIRSARFQAAHYAFMRRWLAGVEEAAVGLLRLRIEIEDRPEQRLGPVLVFSRHAGPGNSLMLIWTLMVAFRRQPRIVMLAKLQWDPLFDTMGNRLPNRFIKHDPAHRGRYVEAIGELATGLGERDAFVLFPEGHDFTERIRVRAIDHLRKRGHEEEAQKAEKMRNVLPPRHGGVMAAILAAPGADVVFVAHTVFEDLGTIAEVWRELPLERPVMARYWRIPAAEVPRERDELIEWLFDWWARIDGWIDQHRPPEGAGGAEVVTGEEAPPPRRSAEPAPDPSA